MSTGALGRFYRRIYLRGSNFPGAVGIHGHAGGVTAGEVDQIKFRNCDDIFDEVDQLQYSWCVFHLVLCGAALFVMLTLTNLYYPKRSTKVSRVFLLMISLILAYVYVYIDIYLYIIIYYILYTQSCYEICGAG